MRKILKIALTALLALSCLSGCQIRERPNRNSVSPDSSPGYGSSDSLPSHSASFPNNSSSSGTYLPWSEADDLATNGNARSVAPYSYGTVSTLSFDNQTVSQNSALSLKGVFSSVDAPVYINDSIWTFISFDVSAYAADLHKKMFQMDLYTENCGPISSITLEYDYGGRSDEVPFDNTFTSSYYWFADVKSLSNGWRRISIDLSELYSSWELNQTSSILIVFSNEECQKYEDSAFYLDNVCLPDF